MKNFKFGRILICCLLVVSAFLFSACATVNATTIANADGTIDELVTIELKTDELLSQDYTSAEIVAMKNKFKQIGSSKVEEICTNFNARIQREILQSKSDAEIKALTSFMGGITSLVNTTETDNWVFGIKFKNADVYRYYYNIAETSSPKYQTEKHFLYTKCYYYGLTMYADYTSVYSQIKAEIGAEYPVLVANNQAEFSFTYETEYRREHSNANSIQKADGKYYHTWVLTEDEFEQPIMIYYNIANSANCILLCIGITIVVCLSLWLIAWIIDKRKKRTE